MINDSFPIIACISGGTTYCAVSVIRISGSFELSDFEHFFSAKILESNPRTSLRRNLISEFNEIIDDVIVVYFKGPNSFTGENILEISCHGNPIIVEKIIDRFVASKKVRMAQAGEFSFRALKNKKIDLIQAEGLGLILSAKNEFSIKQGLSLLNGSLHRDFDHLYDLFLRHKSSLELLLDFSEDVGDSEARDLFVKSFEAFYFALDSLAARARINVNLIDPKIIIFGLPNAGKSSFFNAILNEDRSIVSDIKGTTRDYISSEVMFGMNRFSLIDTAGLRDSNDVIEEMGIKKSMNEIELAFFKILLVNPFDSNIEDVFLYVKKLNIEPDLIVFTHIDLGDFDIVRERFKSFFSNSEFLEISLKSGSIEPKNSSMTKRSGSIEPKNSSMTKRSGSIEPKNSSMTKRSGSIEPLDKSIKKIDAYINKKYLNVVNQSPIQVERVRELLGDGLEMARKYKNDSLKIKDLGIVSHELFTLENCISRLVGVSSADEVLNNIFSTFCIGK